MNGDRTGSARLEEITKPAEVAAQQEVERILGSADVSTYAYSDVAEAAGQIGTSYRESLGEPIWAVSLGIGLPNSVVDRLKPSSAEAAMLYKHHAYDVVNFRLDLVASHLAQAIQGGGFVALPVPASQTVDWQALCSLFPHKTAAHLAGLGWIGKNCLLITPQYGARVRFATVLTNLPLEPSAKRIESKCGTCTECVDICPVQAFTGRPFRESEAREVRFAASSCSEHLAAQKDRIGVDVCGLCLYICPFGRTHS